MGEAEGKKDEADYKRLQTFPLVRVSPREGRQGATWAHTPERGERQARQWEEVKKGFAGSELEIQKSAAIHSFIHSSIQQVFVQAPRYILGTVPGTVDIVLTKADKGLAHMKEKFKQHSLKAGLWGKASSPFNIRVRPSSRQLEVGVWSPKLMKLG